MKNGTQTQPFLTDVTELRKKARTNIEKGVVTPDYQGNVKQTIDILQSVLATEIVCVLRYTMNAVAAAGISSQAVKAEFDEHAREEAEHARQVAERINQLGGKPNMNPGRIGQPLRFPICRSGRFGRDDQRKFDRGAHCVRALSGIGPILCR